MSSETNSVDTGISRRGFLRGAAVAAGAATLTPWDALAARTAAAAVEKKAFSVDYGPLRPTLDHTTGLELLMLPKGFEYLTHSWRADPLSDGTPTPSLHDGMAAFRQGDLVALGRNHEQGAFTGKFTDPAYDPDANGGTSTLMFDPDRGEFVDGRASLSGTIRNCAGGLTPWDSWLTCEETTTTNPVSGIRHGYVFDVPVSGEADATALTAMGRFSHEAVAVDFITGWVYETEDSNPAGLYRFIPNQPGRLAAGGRLEMLMINGAAYDTRTDGTGTTYDSTAWVTIDEPDPAPGLPSPTQQGIAKGGAVFNRLEGIWYSDGKIYIVSTSGGPTGQGQIFEYTISNGAMRVLFASPATDILNNPDNITVSPRGGLVLCEDGSGVEFLHGLTPDGEIFRFAANNVVVPAGGIPGKPAIAPGNYTGAEFAGATFEPDNGNWLFVNIQTPGITFAITGPWRRGAL
jgi:secreted PhoX family phosphatase